jgi:GntR family transcriptional regulator, vanillate catabolism transcriptional regulator
MKRNKSRLRIEPRPLQKSPEPRQSEEAESQTARTLASLRQMLLRGDFRPGERISELSLVSRLSASRTPVRLAMDRLAQEGLLEVSPGGGFSARAFTIAEIFDAIDLRGAVEGTAARWAAERLTSPSELERLRRYCRLMEALPSHPNDPGQRGVDSFVGFTELNTQFHNALVDLAQSSMLRWSLNRFQSVPFAASALIIPEALELVFPIAIAQHQAIVEAIENREGTRAEMITREHARLARKNVEIALSHKRGLNFPGASLLRIDPGALSAR